MSRNARILLLNLKYAVSGGTWWVSLFLFGYAVLILWLSWSQLISDPEAVKGDYVIPIFGGFLLWVLVGQLQAQMMNRVAVFCLPGHRQVQKRLILILGGIISLISCWHLVFYPGLTLGGRILALASGWSLALGCYLLTILLMLGGWRKKLFWLALGVLAVVPLICLITPKGADEILGRWPLVFIVGGGSASILAWRCIMNDEFIRESILRFEISAKQRRGRACQPAAVPSGTVNYKWAGLMEKYYLWQMAKCGYSGKCIWGVLYSHLGPLSAYWDWIVAGVIISSVALGYLEPFGAVAIFSVPAYMTIFWKVPVYGSMLILGGRRERWLSGMVCSMTLVLLLTSVGLAICAFARVLDLFMPTITSFGEKFNYLPVSARLFWVPLVVGPIAFSVDVVTRGKPIAKGVIVFVLFYAGAGAAGLYSEEIWAGLNSMTIAGGILVSWSIFCAVLWLCCMTRNLLGQGERW